MKRFTDTALHRQPWFRKLKPKLKCAVRFLFDECDAAGVWTIDMETLSYFVGVKVDINELFLGVNSDKENRIEKFSKDKVFIPQFVQFQYGHLSENSPAHKPIFLLLRKYSLLDRVLNSLSSNLQEKEKDTDKDKVKDKETETETDKETDFGKSENLFVVPQMFEIFKKVNPKYPGNKERDYKPLLEIYKFLAEQGNSPPDYEILEAWDSIAQVVSKDNFYGQKSLSTVSNHIQEITQIALHGKQSASKNRQPKLDEAKLKAKLSEHLREREQT